MDNRETSQFTLAIFSSSHAPTKYRQHFFPNVIYIKADTVYKKLYKYV